MLCTHWLNKNECFQSQNYLIIYWYPLWPPVIWCVLRNWVSGHMCMVSITWGFKNHPHTHSVPEFTHSASHIDLIESFFHRCISKFLSFLLKKKSCKSKFSNMVLFLGKTVITNKNSAKDWKETNTKAFEKSMLHPTRWPLSLYWKQAHG